MRDIRQDLSERIATTETDIAHLQKRVSDLESQKKRLEALLRDEEQLWSASSPSPIQGYREFTRQQRLTEIILDIMSGGEEWLGGTIAAVAEKRGHNFGTSAPGRSIHFTILGLVKQGKIENAGLGKWRLKRSKHNATNEDAA